MSQNKNNLKSFSTLVDIMSRLRSENGCPWDKEQTHKSLAQYAIEETYELVEAIEAGNDSELSEELGDLLLQVVFHAEIAKQEGRFDIHNVIEKISEKLIRRHPHVFSDVQVSSAEEVVTNWQKIKAGEKKVNGKVLSVKDGLSPIGKAQKIGSECQKLGFDWPNITSLLDKVQEEISEFKESLKSQDSKNQKEELGDLLFSVIQLARFIKVDAESSLRDANRKFISRFEKMMNLVESQAQSWNNMSPEQKEHYWSKVKQLELNKGTTKE